MTDQFHTCHWPPGLWPHFPTIFSAASPVTVETGISSTAPLLASFVFSFSSFWESSSSESSDFSSEWFFSDSSTSATEAASEASSWFKESASDSLTVYPSTSFTEAAIVLVFCTFSEFSSAKTIPPGTISDNESIAANIFVNKLFLFLILYFPFSFLMR